MTADPEQSAAQPLSSLELMRDDDRCGNETRCSGHTGKFASLERRSSYLHVPIVQDFEASSDHELTVTCGQLVEVIPDRCRRELETADQGRHSGPGWCFVRLLSVFESRCDETCDVAEAEVLRPASPPTGYVPMEVLGLAPASSPTIPKETKDLSSGNEVKPSKRRTQSLREAIKRLGSMKALFLQRSSTGRICSTPRRRSNSISQFYVDRADLVSRMEGLLPADAESSVHSDIAEKMQQQPQQQPEADALTDLHDAGAPIREIGKLPAKAEVESRLPFPQQPSTPTGLRRNNALSRRRSKSLDHLPSAQDAAESMKKLYPASSVPSRDVVGNSVDVHKRNEKIEEVNGPSEEEMEKFKRLRRCAVQELVDTERVYIDDLGLVVNGYMEQIKQLPMLPETLQGSDKVVFGNIHQIYDFHRNKFAPMIEKSVEDPHHLGCAFQRYGKDLRTMYTKYCENKPRSEFVVMENQEFFSGLQQTLTSKPITDLLIKPIQRFLKYELLLKEIHKNSKRCMENCEELEAALQVMRIVASAANDMMSVGRLQGFTGNIMQQGSLLHQGKIAVAEVGDAKGDEKARELHVFLFEQVIIFCEEMERRSSLTPPSYLFKHAVWVNNMLLESRAPCRRLRKGSSRGTIDTKGAGGASSGTSTTVNDELLPFLLIGRTRGSELRLILQPADLETRTVWLNHINEMLRLQRELTTALLDPQKHMKKLNDIGVGGWPPQSREAGGGRASAS